MQWVLVYSRNQHSQHPKKNNKQPETPDEILIPSNSSQQSVKKLEVIQEEVF